MEENDQGHSRCQWSTFGVDGGIRTSGTGAERSRRGSGETRFWPWSERKSQEFARTDQYCPRAWICLFPSAPFSPLSLVLSSVKIPSVCSVLFYLRSFLHFLFLAITSILLSSGVSTSPFFLFRSFVLPFRLLPSFNVYTHIFFYVFNRSSDYSSSTIFIVFPPVRIFYRKSSWHLLEIIYVFSSNSIISLQLFIRRIYREELYRKIYRFFLRKKRGVFNTCFTYYSGFFSTASPFHFAFSFFSSIQFAPPSMELHVRASFSILLISFLRLPSLTVLLVLSVCSLSFANALLDSFLSLSPSLCSSSRVSLGFRPSSGSFHHHSFRVRVIVYICLRQPCSSSVLFSSSLSGPFSTFHFSFTR